MVAAVLVTGVVAYGMYQGMSTGDISALAALPSGAIAAVWAITRRGNGA